MGRKLGFFTNSPRRNEEIRHARESGDLEVDLLRYYRVSFEKKVWFSGRF